MNENKAIKALLTAALLIPLLSSFAYANQSPSPSMKDQMKAMKEGSKATTIAGSSPAPTGGTYFTLPIPTKVLTTKLFDVNGKNISLNDFKSTCVICAKASTTAQCCNEPSTSTEKQKYLRNGARLMQNNRYLIHQTEYTV